LRLASSPAEFDDQTTRDARDLTTLDADGHRGGRVQWALEPEEQ
jgi:hypothetical protein